MIAPPRQAIRELYPEFVEDWLITGTKKNDETPPALPAVPAAPRASRIESFISLATAHSNEPTDIDAMDIDAMIAPPRQAVRAGQAVRELRSSRTELPPNH
eukprot:scaffold11804_cov30-Cyclotella_meneghiniana.AAC.1